VIKNNIPSRIAFAVSSGTDSRTIIDINGAEKLMGKGDMLYFPVSVPKPIRVQGAFISPTECDNIVSFIKANGTAQYDDKVQQEIERQAAVDKKKGAASEELAPGGAGKDDDLVNRAIELFVSAPEKASISALQRHLSLRFAKAGRLMDTLEEKGIVGPTEGSKPRKVLITKAQWYEMNAMSAEVTDPGLRDFDDISDPD
jgi:S-DNA-T family DNA segregation ATPase FtsK/SpoIIIE